MPPNAENYGITYMGRATAATFSSAKGAGNTDIDLNVNGQTQIAITSGIAGGATARTPVADAVTITGVVDMAPSGATDSIQIQQNGSNLPVITTASGTGELILGQAGQNVTIAGSLVAPGFAGTANENASVDLLPFSAGTVNNTTSLNVTKADLTNDTTTATSDMRVEPSVGGLVVGFADAAFGSNLVVQPGGTTNTLVVSENTDGDNAIKISTTSATATEDLYIESGTGDITLGTTGSGTVTIANELQIAGVAILDSGANGGALTGTAGDPNLTLSAFNQAAAEVQLVPGGTTTSWLAISEDGTDNIKAATSVGNLLILSGDTGGSVTLGNVSDATSAVTLQNNTDVNGTLTVGNATSTRIIGSGAGNLQITHPPNGNVDIGSTLNGNVGVQNTLSVAGLLTATASITTAQVYNDLDHLTLAAAGASLEVIVSPGNGSDTLRVVESGSNVQLTTGANALLITSANNDVSLGTDAAGTVTVENDLTVDGVLTSDDVTSATTMTMDVTATDWLQSIRFSPGGTVTAVQIMERADATDEMAITVTTGAPLTVTGGNGNTLLGETGLGTTTVNHDLRAHNVDVTATGVLANGVTGDHLFLGADYSAEGGEVRIQPGGYGTEGTDYLCLKETGVGSGNLQMTTTAGQLEITSNTANIVMGTIGSGLVCIANDGKIEGALTIDGDLIVNGSETINAFNSTSLNIEDKIINVATSGGAVNIDWDAQDNAGVTELQRISGNEVDAAFTARTDVLDNPTSSHLVLFAGNTYRFGTGSGSFSGNTLILSATSAVGGGAQLTTGAGNGTVTLNGTQGDAGDISATNIVWDTTGVTDGNVYYLGSNTNGADIKIVVRASTTTTEGQASCAGLVVDAITYDGTTEVDYEKSVRWCASTEGTLGSGDSYGAWELKGGHLQMTREIPIGLHSNPTAGPARDQEVAFQWRVANDERLELVKIKGTKTGDAQITAGEIIASWDLTY